MSGFWLDDKQSVKYKNKIPSEKPTARGVKSVLAGSDDIVFSTVAVGKVKADVCCVDGLVKESVVDENILSFFTEAEVFKKCKTQQAAVNLILNGFVSHASVKRSDSLEETVDGILSSNFVVIFSEVGIAFIFDVKGFERRSIDEPENESVINGSKDGFVEPVRLNTAIVRRHLRSHNLVVKQTELGDEAKATVAVIYMKNIADDTLVKEVQKRLEAVSITAFFSMGQLESALEGGRSSLIPKIIYTERADKFCANIMNGRVGIIVDGFPCACIVPANLALLLQAPEDYSEKPAFASFIRIIRYGCLGVSLFLPAVYLGVVNYSCEILPAKLAQSIMLAKNGVPFTAFTEIFVMLIAFEVLIEAGLRLPGGIGQAVSIVAGLIIGEAAINANLVSPAVVMVIAASGIASFVLPYQILANPLRVIRFGLMLAAQAAGLFGVGIGVVLTVLYFNSVQSFSLPYLAPFSTSGIKDWFRDTVIRKNKTR